MNLRHLSTFLAIARQGSFTAAAHELSYSPSTVTLHIQELEAELGVALFHRAGRSITPTEAGRTLIRHAREIVERVELVRRSMRDLAADDGGRVAIGSSEPAASLRLPPILMAFSELRPKVSLSVEVGGTRGLCHLVAAEELDFAVCSAPRLGLDLEFQPLFREELALLAPDDHPLLRSSDVGEHLRHSVFLTTEETCSYRQAIDRSLAEAGLSTGSLIEINSMRTIALAVQSGLGVALVPVSVADPPPPGTTLREIPGVEVALTMGIVTRRGGQIGAAADDLRALLVHRLAHLETTPKADFSATPAPRRPGGAALAMDNG